MAVRTFIALELSRPLKEGILDLVEALRKDGLKASWPKAGTLHLTLKFLGDVEEEFLYDVTLAVRRAALDIPPFVLAASGLGAFPTARRPRVVWVGIEPVDELWDLAAGVEEELAGIGFPRDRRRFSPHITVGRIREPRGSIEGLLETLDAPRERVEVREVLVMKSTLRPGGALHEVIAAVPLGGGGSSAETANEVRDCP
jgi:2'-5' RNA ligase